MPYVIILVVLTDLKPILCGTWCPKICQNVLVQLVSYKAAPQEPHRVISILYIYIYYNKIILWCVHKDCKMANVKRHAYNAGLKLKSISHAVEYGNKTAAK